MKRINFVTIAVLIGTLAHQAAAADFTFTGAFSSNWNDARNWDQGVNTPGASDSATIGSGKLCTVQDQDESIGNIFVVGTLKLIDRGLTIGGISGTDDRSTIDGALQFKHNGGTAPILYISGTDIEINGSGVLDATSTNGFGPARITRSASSTDKIEFSGSIQVKGAFTFDNVKIWIDSPAKLAVDSADTMDIGYPNSCGLQGDGTLQVSAGSAILDHVANGDEVPVWNLAVSGGQIEIGSASSLASTYMKAHISGGTLDVDADLVGSFFEFTGGTINVLAGTTLRFDQDGD